MKVINPIKINFDPQDVQFKALKQFVEEMKIGNFEEAKLYIGVKTEDDLVDETVFRMKILEREFAFYSFITLENYFFERIKGKISKIYYSHLDNFNMDQFEELLFKNPEKLCSQKDLKLYNRVAVIFFNHPMFTGPTHFMDLLQQQDHQLHARIIKKLWPKVPIEEKKEVAQSLAVNNPYLAEDLGDYIGCYDQFEFDEIEHKETDSNFLFVYEVY